MVCHLLGLVDFESCLALQHRLVYEASGRTDGLITLLMCEHPQSVTIGREGSRTDVHLDSAELRKHELDLRWVNRGGGAVVHAPGQLAIYPIVPLEFHGLTVGAYLERFFGALSAAITEEGVHPQPIASRRCIAGRHGPLATMGVAVRNWVAYFGAYLNVSPALQLIRHVDAISDRPSRMSSLAAERQQPVRMPSVRERVARHLSDAFGCSRYHVYTGHPLLVSDQRHLRETTARAG